MILYGTMELQTINRFTGVAERCRPVRSSLMSKKMNNKYCIFVKTSKAFEAYNLTDIEKIHCRFIEDGKVTFLFKEPKRNLLFHGDDVKMVKLFLNEIQRAMKGERVEVSEQQMPTSVPTRKRFNPFDPRSLEHIAVDRFDSRVLNMRNLTKLILENCYLPSLPIEIGNLSIVHISLSGSNITSPQCQINQFWTWMSGDKICKTLNILELDTIKLTSLPFEINFLENLSTLSLKNNKLSYLPNFIGELDKLRRLYVSNNLLVYFPYSMLRKTFDVLDISDNKRLSTNLQDFVIRPGEMDTVDHILKYQNELDKVDEVCRSQLSAMKLGLLAFCVLVDKKIKIKREDIPHTLWHLYNVVSRCIFCNTTVAPHYGALFYAVQAPSAITLIKNQSMSVYTWQSLTCKFGCQKDN